MARHVIPDTDLNAFSTRFRSETDRACAVLGAALLDARLEAVFRRRLAEYKDELLDSDRALGAFATRIKLGRALGWIDNDVCSDLDNIRNIRNTFAHSADHDLEFDDQSVRDRCGNLRIPQAYLDGLDDPQCRLRQNLSSNAIQAIRNTVEGPRQRYQIAVEFLVQCIDEIPEALPQDPPESFLEEVMTLARNMQFTAQGEGHVGPRK